MAYKIFLDTNIIADFLDRERPEHTSALALFNEIERQNVFAYFSESVVNTASYVLRKILPALKFKIFMTDLLSNITILPCSNTIILNAYHNAKNDLEDAVLYQIALQSEMEYFITSNIKDFKKLSYPLLPVVSAKNFLELFYS